MLFALGILASGRGDAGPLGGSLGIVGAPVQIVVNTLTNSISSVVDHYIYLVGAREESEVLRVELDTLRHEMMKISEYQYENERLKDLLGFKQQTDLPMLPAMVAARSASAWYRTLILDKGSTQGVQNGSPVVTAAGVVGRVFDVNDTSCRVLLLTDASSAVDALVQRTRVQLLVEGNMGPEPRLMYLARGVDAQAGDRVVSSGLDGIYPKGMLLGSIENLEQLPGELFQTAILKPSVDFARLEEVLIILPQTEQER